MADREGDRLGRLRRDMGLFSATAVVVGNCVGAGIFITPSIVFMDAGSVGADLLVWIAAGIASFIHGLCIAELGTMLPSAGGPYEFVSVGAKSLGKLGDVLPFLFAWSFVLLDPAAVAIHGLAFTSYALSLVYGSCTPPHAVTALLTVVVIELSAAVNSFSLKTSMKVQNVLFVVKIAILLAIIVTGAICSLREPALLTKFSFNGHTTPGKLVEAFAVASFTGAGSAMVACMAEEMSDPSRTIPRSLLGGLFLVTVLLVLTNVAYFVVLDLDSVMASEATAVAFARATWGTAGVYLVPAIVCVCAFGTMSSSFLSHSRLLMAAARKRHLPWAFSLITMNSSLPIVAIASRCCLAILFAVTGSVGLLVKGGMTVLSLMTIMVMLAMLRLRVTMKDAERPIRVPTWLVFADIAISLVVVLVPVLAATQVSQYAIALGCVLAGFPAYVALKAAQRSKFGTSMNRFLQRLMLSVPCVHR
ncbi:b(0,+)-type amino acid transporter 1-like isoform X2 [Dermacentor albipictus]|uniref:b(0,+)-type amino acid transporter 1-like isoform X2 n=1 Tax=Dermacentor albipictus TaxID=60249 RepID=UPI0038FC227C